MPNEPVKQTPNQEQKPKWVGKIPLGSMPKRRPGFLGRKNLMDYGEKDVYVAPKRMLLPPWLIPLVAFALVILLVFWILPGQLAPSPEPTVPVEVVLPPKEDDLAVVQVSVADVFDSPYVRGKRITQVLYNEPLKILSTEPPNHIRVELPDGTRGFVLRSDLSAEIASVTPRDGMLKVIVRGDMKPIMSAASAGTRVAEAPMGTILYSDYSSDQVMRLLLPSGGYGWITKDSVFIFDDLEALPEPDHFVQSFTSSAMAFFNAPWMPSGQTLNGISPEGAARVAGLLNGKILPYTLEKMAEVGQEVTLPVDPETREFDLRYLREGDLVFFHPPDDEKRIESVAICMPERQWLRAEQNRASLRLGTISEQRDMARWIYKVVRLTDD